MTRSIGGGASDSAAAETDRRAQSNGKAGSLLFDLVQCIFFIVALIVVNVGVVRLVDAALDLLHR